MNKLKIPGIFNDSSILQIPFFQRSYVWLEPNWERFLNDLKTVSSNDKDYFLGTYIMKQQNTPSGDSNGTTVRTVIDGQQRFTTIILFIYTLCKLSNDTELFNRICKNYYGEIILRHNYHDKEIFNAILDDKLSEQLRKKYENNRVLKAFDYFMSTIQPEDYDIKKLLGRLYFVGIDLEANEDEQQIFDTINSLGVRLTTAELLKNRLFSSNKDLELYQNTWEKCFEVNEKKEFWDATITAGSKVRSNIDLFLYSYLAIHYSEDLTVEKLFENFKTYLENIDYDNNKEDVLQDIIEYAEIYYDNINSNCCAERLVETKNSINRLNIIFFGLETTTLLPYCLYILKKATKDEQCRIFGFLENYIMRRMICDWSTKNYNNMFLSFIRKELISLDELQKEIYNSKKDETTNAKMPNDEELRICLNEKDHTNKKAKGILYLLEVALHDDKDNTSIIGLSSYDLEHIMPKDWKKNWNDFDLNEIELVEKREKHIGRLGNKTILTSQLNKSIKNANWQTKLNGNITKKLGGFKEYAQGLKTFNFDDLPKWNETTIDNRTNDLFAKIIGVWPYNH